MAASEDTSTYKYVFLGCGNAAGYAAREFVANDVAADELCIVGDEPTLPYERPALSKAVLTKAEVRLPGFHTCVGGGGDRQNADFYETNGIQMKLGDAVVSADLANKTLTTAGNKQYVATEALILGTGAAPIRLDKMPGGNLNGVLYLRDNAEAMVLYDALQANIGKDIVIVGGGYIGMEVAAAAATVGCNVNMVFPESHLMSRLFTPEIAAHYEKAYEEKGIKFHKNGRVCKEFLGDDDGNVRGVVMCKDDEIEELAASLVVVGVGARPNTQMFKDQLEMDERGGVIVDASMKTSVDGVYAVGDIATFPLKIYGNRPTRAEHVGNARQTASHAVKSIYGGTEPYDYLPFFYSRVFGFAWQFFGDSVGEPIVVGDFNPKLAAFWVSEGNIVGVFCESPAPEDTDAMRAFARAQPPIDVEKLKSASSVDEAFQLIKAA